MLSGLKGNKEFFTWGYLYEKLRMRLSYDLMKDPIKEKKILKKFESAKNKMHFQCYTRHFRPFKSVAENIFVSLWIMKYLASIPMPKNNKKKLNFNFEVMVVIRSYLNFGKLHFELRILRK